MPNFFNTEIPQEELDRWFKELEEKEEIAQARARIIIDWIEKNSMQSFMERIIKEHDNSYRDKCYKKGYMPYPTNKFDLLFGYIQKEFEPVNVPELDSDFMNVIYFFKGYYFQIIHGQGSFLKIFDGEKNCVLVI